MLVVKTMAEHVLIRERRRKILFAFAHLLSLSLENWPVVGRYRIIPERASTQRAARQFQILNHRAEIDRLGVNGLVFGDLGPVEDLESVAFEKFLAATAFESNDLAANAFLAAAVEITQIRAHQGAGGGHFSRFGQKIDVKMRHSPGTGRHFAPAIHQDPADETTGAIVVAKISRQRPEKEPHILVERVELVAQRPAATEQVTADFALHLQKKTRVRLVIGVISGKKVGKQFAIFIHRINRIAEKSGVAAEFSHRVAVRPAVATDEERFLEIARHLKPAVF